MTYASRMATREQLRAFLDRPWERLRELKDLHNAKVVADDAEAALAMGEALAQRAEEAGARFTEEDRAADLATAIRLRRLLDRAGRHYVRAR